MRVWCIYGAYTRRQNCIYNEAVVVDRKGQTLYIYQKQHLWQLMEKGEITPGPGTNRVIETEFGKIGVIICWDIAFPEATRKLAQQGAQIVFCPAYWYGRQHHTSEIIRILPQVRAFENQIYFVLCDAATWETAGRSRICSSLQTLAATNNTDERILIATADLEELEKRRRLFDCWRTQQRSKSDIACAFPPGSSIEEIE